MIGSFKDLQKIDFKWFTIEMPTFVFVIINLPLSLYKMAQSRTFPYNLHSLTPHFVNKKYYRNVNVTCVTCVRLDCG